MTNDASDDEAARRRCRFITGPGLSDSAEVAQG